MNPVRGSVCENPSHGFSLVEVLVAISILLIAVTAPLTIVVRTTQGSQFANQQVVATFLAQEGLELAQKARDDAFLGYFDELLNDPPAGSTPWDDFSDEGGSYASCYAANGCGLYIRNTGSDGKVQIKSCTSAGCQLYLDITGPNIRSRYTNDGTGNKPESPYARTVRFENLSDHEVRVVSEVTWRTGTIKGSQQVVTQTSLLNLYDLP